MKRERNFSHITDEAIGLLRQGQTIPAILSRYPDDAARLAPYLRTAQTIMRTPQPQPPTGIEAASKAKMMAGLSEKKTNFSQHKEDIMDDLGAGFQRERGKKLILAILLLATIFIFLSTLSVSALAALPGSPLYQVKLALQDMRVLLTFNPILRQARCTYYYHLRLLDLERAVELNRITEMNAQATITAMPTPKAMPILP
ncbi:MAG: hypothetical protein H0S79_13120 [Anaerolineaceae bacterium]|jgi:hypothetical protein|nr:hypothetical protein [Anaerolineaceae bacterium]